jgi:hypothetical protein
MILWLFFYVSGSIITNIHTKGRSGGAEEMRSRGAEGQRR